MLFRSSPLQDEEQLFRDPHLAERNFYSAVETVDTGVRSYQRPLWLMSKAQGTIRRGPVALGEDNEYLYKEVLHTPDELYDRLVARGDISDTPDPSLP